MARSVRQPDSRTRRALTTGFALFLFAGAFLLGSGASSADSLTVALTAVGDTHVYSGAATTNYGTQNHVNASASSWRGLLKFDTSTIPAGATITAVDLEIDPSVSESSGGFQIHPESTAWQETTVTWASQPTWNTTSIAISATPTVGVVLDTHLPLNAVTSAGESDFGLSYSVGGLIAKIASRETSTPPQLVVSYTTDTSSSSTTVPSTTTTTTGVATTTTTSVPSTTTAATTTTLPSAGAVPSFDHVVVVVEENHSYSQIIGDTADAPYVNSLAAGGANFTNSYAVAHPSQPNYLALFSGATQGVVDDTCPPPGSPFATDNLGAQMVAAGREIDGYFENLPQNGYSSGGYACQHNPMIDFSNFPASHVVPFSQFPTDFTTLPKLAIVVPDVYDDMHTGIVRLGDAWLENFIGPYAAWAVNNNSLLVVTWDEDNGSTTNLIPTIFYGPHIKPGNYGEAINHYTVLRTLEAIEGLPGIGNAANLGPITSIWATGP